MYKLTKEFEIACNVFGKEGIVLDIKVHHDTGTHFWNCNYWSSFINENERFLIGGMDKIEFTTIRDIVNSLNYQLPIKVMTILTHMVQGYQLLGIAPSAKDVSTLSRIIDAISDEKKRASIPTYVYDLFIHFFQKQENMLINWNDWTHHKIQYVEAFKFYGYGYKKFHKYFVNSTDSDNLVLKYSIFVGIMPNLSTFTLFDATEPGKLNKSISLTSKFADELKTCISILDNVSFSPFKHFQFVEPNGNIKEFINAHENGFKTKGWELCHVPYQYIPFNLNTNHSLLVKRI